MKIKICGIRTADEAGYLNEAGINYAGCVFYEKSKRNISIGQAEAILDALDTKITPVAVTVSPDVRLLKDIEGAGFKILQVHKELTEEVLKASEIPIWYACNIADEESLKGAAEMIKTLPQDLKDKIKGIVIDAPDYGSGKTFDWKISDILSYRKSRRMLKAGAQSPPEMQDHKKGSEIRDAVAELFADRDFILAGGLTPDNVAEGIRLFAPDIVDVSSGVENDTGKSREKILGFTQAVIKEISDEQ